MSDLMVIGFGCLVALAGMIGFLITYKG